MLLVASEAVTARGLRPLSVLVRRSTLEVMRQPPKVNVCNKRYVFNSSPQKGDFSATGLMSSLLGAVILLAIVNLFRRGSVR